MDYNIEDSFIGTVRRLGLSTFRIAMILTTLRLHETKNYSQVIICNDTDFNTAMSITETLIQHASLIFQQLPKENPEPVSPIAPQKRLLQALPQEFDRKTYLATAKTLGMPAKTAEKQIARFVNSGLLQHPAHDKYHKT